MLVVAGLCGYVALMTPDWKSDLVAKTGIAYKNNYTYTTDGATPTSDVLFMNTTTGNLQYWPGAVKALDVKLGNFDVSNFTYVGTGDFDGDGNADLLFTNLTTNMAVVWPSGLKSNPSAPIYYPGTGTSGFTVAAVCDFDGDHKDDILWYNSTTGASQIWHDAVKSNITYPGTQTDLTASVAGCGDFDGDQKEDILWHYSSTGGNVVWLSGSKINKLYLTGNPIATYSIAGVGDFDGDGKADILWVNSANGETEIWPSGLKAGATFPGTATSGFVVAAVADYDGDGQSDVLWSNPTTSGLQIWPGAVKANATYPGSYPAALTPQQ